MPPKRRRAKTQEVEGDVSLSSPRKRQARNFRGKYEGKVALNSPKSLDKGKGKEVKKEIVWDKGESGKRKLPEKKQVVLDEDEDEEELTPLPSDMECEEEKEKEKEEIDRKEQHNSSDSSSSSEDEDWENCLQEEIIQPVSSTMAYEGTGNLDITLEQNRSMPLTSGSGKKGISAVERRIRMTTHMLHVQLLLFHGFRRNSWLCDEELQAILLSHVAPGIFTEVEKYHRNVQRRAETQQRRVIPDKKGKGKGKSKGSTSTAVGSDDVPDSTSRTIDSGASDPLVHLLGSLMHFWKKKFHISAPGLRKRGYMSMTHLSQLLSKLSNYLSTSSTESALEKEKREREELELKGERIDGLEGFRDLAGRLEGSRDVGAQFFTALLRALGFEARMVFSMQPLGYSFHGGEMADSNEVKDGEGGGKDNGGGKDGDEKNDKPEKRQKRGRGTEQPRKMRKEWKEDEDMETSSSEFENDDGDVDLNDSEAEIAPPTPTKRHKTQWDKSLPFPIFWTEIYSPHTRTWYAIDPLVLTRIFFRSDTFSQLGEPRGKSAQLAKQGISYIVAYNSDLTAKDITVRYLTKNMVPGKTRASRIQRRVISVKDGRGGGRVVTMGEFDWFRAVMRWYEYRKPEWEDEENAGERREREREEDRGLVGVRVEKEKKENNTESIQGYKNHPDFILERHLKREEAVKPGRSHVKIFTVGKGDKAKQEKVYRRQDIVICKTTENWYKEGRVIKEGEQPLKRVKQRAVTLIRKRELEQAAAENNPVLQGLYSYEQTKLYVPLPVVDGRVPRNVFGNCDVYVPSMIPSGAVHLPLKGSAKIAKKLGVDFADAVTGFEFKKQRAVPVIEGVVIAAENEGLLRDAWMAEEKEKKRKEDVKREQAALAAWRRFLMGIRVVKRIREEYGQGEGEGEDRDEVEWGGRKKGEGQGGKSKPSILAEDQEGGFLREDEDGHKGGGGFLSGEDGENEMEGGFFREDDDDGLSASGSIADDDHIAGGFLPEVENKPTDTTSRPRPISLRDHSSHIQKSSMSLQHSRRHRITSLTDLNGHLDADPSSSSADEAAVDSPSSGSKYFPRRLKGRIREVDDVDAEQQQEEKEDSPLTDPDEMGIDVDDVFSPPPPQSIRTRTTKVSIVIEKTHTQTTRKKTAVMNIRADGGQFTNTRRRKDTTVKRRSVIRRKETHSRYFSPASGGVESRAVEEIGRDGEEEDDEEEEEEEEGEGEEGYTSRSRGHGSGNIRGAGRGRALGIGRGRGRVER